MYHAYWFGVTYTFTCPKCQEINFEKAAINLETIDQAKLNRRINEQFIRCQFCPLLFLWHTRTPVKWNCATVWFCGPGYSRGLFVIMLRSPLDRQPSKNPAQPPLPLPGCSAKNYAASRNCNTRSARQQQLGSFPDSC